VKRASVVVVALQGDLGKPRPAVVVQGEIGDHLRGVIVCPITSVTEPQTFLRPSVAPSAANGLRRPSFIMVDKPISVPRERIHGPVGELDDETMEQVSRSLALILGLA
jgi:mRNA interferase MazF